MNATNMLVLAGVGLSACASSQMQMSQDIEIRTMQTRSGTITYREKGQGTPVIMIHATGHDHHDFDAIFPTIAETYRAIALDLPGHGESFMPSPPESATVLVMANALEEFVEGISKEPVILIGNSVGGFSAIRLALSKPGRVKALVLVNSGGFHDLTLGTRMFTRLKGTEVFTSLVWNKFPENYIKARNSHSQEILERIQRSKTVEHVAVGAAVWRSFLLPEHDLRESAKNLNTPTMLIWGELDPVIPGELGLQAAKIIPGAKIKLMKTGHTPFAEAPEEFLKHLLPFLERPH
ncbi:MAG: alpha/beta hydrolase [Spirochaetia bacterium]|nr:alpha/beta hydrolase [Spirochaetia bacterium]